MSGGLPWLALCAAALVALLFAEQRASALGKWLTKPVASLGFLGLALSRAQGAHPAPDHLMAGLVLCALGDVLLIPKDRRAFVAGIFGFMAGHVAYTLTFLERGAHTGALQGAAVALALPAGFVLAWLWPRLSERAPGMIAPVTAYILVICAMVAAAVSTWAASRSDALLLGALLFFVSDLFVARNRFVTPGFKNRLIGLPLYYAGQCLLAWSV